MESLDHITVSVSDLLEQVEAMRGDGVKFVELSILPPDALDGEALPASLSLSGLMPDDPSGLIDYGTIDASDV